MSMKKELTCIVCPIGCALVAELDAEGKVCAISGNTCKRGEKYAFAELTHPTRTLTTTVRVEGRSEMLPVKTAAPISKEKLLPAMRALRDVCVRPPVRIGDVICKDLVGEADLVATATIE